MMIRRPGTSTTATDRAQLSARPATFARLLLLGAILCLTLSASPAIAATGAPELIAPTASSSHNSPLSVEYKLPEAGANATITFVPTSGPAVVVTLTSAAAAAGKHHFFLDLHGLADETANVAEATASSLPDGEYGVTLSYQNLKSDPAASATALKVAIKTATAPPVVFEPAPGQTFRKPFTVSYALPEAALPGTVKLLLIGAHAGTKTFVLTSSAAGVHSAEIVPSIPASGAGVASAPAEKLPTDSYQLVLSYQDTFANAAATSSSLGLNIAYPLCEAGSYSASGEEPCAKAPKGYFVATSGANHASECPLGHFADAEGLSECLPAQPGSYVPATGANAELECEQGTYNEQTAQSSCLSAPFGHYAPRGSLTPTACPAGTFDAHTNSPSAEFCEYDSPGWYSGEGAAEPIPCIPGKYAFAYGSEECLPAPAGSYVDSIGASVYTPCPAGSYAPVSASTSCITTPENTYATGGASEATACPAGTQSPAGASACSAVSKDSNEVASGATGKANSATTDTTATTPTPTPTPKLISPAVGPAAKFAITTAKRAASLARTRRQRYAVTCSTPVTVQLRVGAVLRAGHKHLALTAPAVALKCKPGKATEAAAAFKLTNAAKKLLRKHGAAVKLTVRVYTSGAPAAGRLASATVRGTP